MKITAGTLLGVWLCCVLAAQSLEDDTGRRVPQSAASRESSPESATRKRSKPDLNSTHFLDLNSTHFLEDGTRVLVVPLAELPARLRERSAEDATPTHIIASAPGPQ